MTKFERPDAGFDVVVVREEPGFDSGFDENVGADDVNDAGALRTKVDRADGVEVGACDGSARCEREGGRTDR